MQLFVPLCHSFLFTMKLMFYFSLLNGHICRTRNLPYFALIIMVPQVGSGFLEDFVQPADFFPQSIRGDKKWLSVEKAADKHFFLFLILQIYEL